MTRSLWGKGEEVAIPRTRQSAFIKILGEDGDVTEKIKKFIKGIKIN